MTALTGAARLARPASFIAAPGVGYLEIGGQPLLHDARRQQLFSLNETAAALWRWLVDDGGTDDDLDPAAAETVRGWVREGFLLPALAFAPDPIHRTVVLDELHVQVRLHAADLAAPYDAVFAHLAGCSPAAPVRLDLVRWRDLTLILRDGEFQAAAEADSVVAQVKAALTTLYAAAVREAFLAHGAWLNRNGRTLFLTGPPGAGKTTLTLALVADGWRYGGDDIVRVEPDGRMSGAPFAATVKSGAWDLLAASWRELANLAAWRRSDGQVARYLLPTDRLGRRPTPPDAIVLLDRRAATEVSFDPIQPLAALTALIGSAYAEAWRPDAGALAALGRRCEDAVCATLTYASLDEAVAMLRPLADG